MTHPTPEPGSYEARHQTPAQKRAATLAAAAARHAANQARWPAKPAPAARCCAAAPTPAITEGRFAAFALPSRVGNRLHYPDGRLEEINQ